MERPLPQYTQKEINETFALAIMVGFEALNPKKKEIIQRVSSNRYLLKQENGMLVNSAEVLETSIRTERKNWKNH